MSIPRCPSCKTGKLKVIDSRPAAGEQACRRRYTCTCGVRFSSMEIVFGKVVMRDPKKKYEYALSKNALADIAIKRIIGGACEEL